MSLQIPLVALLFLVALRVGISAVHTHLDRIHRLDRSLVPVPAVREVGSVPTQRRRLPQPPSDLAA
jgi:hypothetical protein